MKSLILAIFSELGKRAGLSISGSAVETQEQRSQRIAAIDFKALESSCDRRRLGLDLQPGL